MLMERALRKLFTVIQVEAWHPDGIEWLKVCYWIRWADFGEAIDHCVSVDRGVIVFSSCSWNEVRNDCLATALAIRILTGFMCVYPRWKELTTCQSVPNRGEHVHPNSQDQDIRAQDSFGWWLCSSVLRPCCNRENTPLKSNMKRGIVRILPVFDFALPINCPSTIWGWQDPSVPRQLPPMLARGSDRVRFVMLYLNATPANVKNATGFSPMQVVSFLPVSVMIPTVVSVIGTMHQPCRVSAMLLPLLLPLLLKLLYTVSKPVIACELGS